MLFLITLLNIILGVLLVCGIIFLGPIILACVAASVVAAAPIILISMAIKAIMKKK